jgi:hypothetical protein
MTHGACLLVAIVMLVQSSFDVQAEAEVTTRGHLRGNSATVTTAVPAGTNETAAADEKQVCIGCGGATSPLQAPDEGCKEVVKQVEEAFIFETLCRPSNFTPLSCIAPVVAGMNYFAKVDVRPCGVYCFAHLRIYKGLGEDIPATLHDVALDVEMNTTLEYFGSETAEEETLEVTLGAAMENSGEEMLEATLGYRRCGKDSALCMTDWWCCSGRCASFLPNSIYGRCTPQR